MDEQGQEHVEELPLEPVAVMPTRHPRALWGVLAIVAVAAGALVVTSANDDGNQVPGLPVDLASRSSGGDEAAAADSSMRAWVTYVAGDDLPSLGGEATAYRLSGEVDEDQVRELADALGLEGDVQSDGASSWWVDGGTGRLDVYAGSGASWSFFAGDRDCLDADGSIGGCCDSSEPCTTFDSTGVAIGDCIESASGPEGCGYSEDGDSASSAGCIDQSTDAGEDDCAEPTTTTSVCYSKPPTAPCEPPDPPQEDPGVDYGGQDCNDVGTPTAPPSDGDEPVASPPAAACEAPLPDLPPLEGEDDAKDAALAVVAASGADVDDARVDAQSGGESRSWYVTVEPVVDGIATGLFSYVEVTEAGLVISGGGYLGQPEALGDYPLLDTRAAIDRANAQNDDTGIEPAVGVADDVATTGGDDGGSTDVGGTTGGDDPVTTIVGGGTDPCAPPEGASDGCGGTTGCGGDGCVDPGVEEQPCKVQPDGREICEYDSGCSAGSADGETVTTLACEVPPCPDIATTDDVAVGAPEMPECTPPPMPCAPPGAEGPPESKECPSPEPVPEPEPIEIVLVDAERSLVLFPANDGSADAYLIPAYRFTAEDGGTVDLPAVADEALAGPDTPDTTVPDTVDPGPAPEPQPCEVLEEEDPASATTHTIQTCPPPDEDALVIGEGYYVDIDTQCAGGSFVLGNDVWVTDNEEVAGWADPGERHEGGTFTLDTEDHGTFRGDAAGDLVAEFEALGPAEDIFCTPEPR